MSDDEYLIHVLETSEFAYMRKITRKIHKKIFIWEESQWENAHSLWQSSLWCLIEELLVLGIFIRCGSVPYENGGGAISILFHQICLMEKYLLLLFLHKKEVGMLISLLIFIFSFYSFFILLLKLDFIVKIDNRSIDKENKNLCSKSHRLKTYKFYESSRNK